MLAGRYKKGQEAQFATKLAELIENPVVIEAAKAAVARRKALISQVQSMATTSCRK